MMTYMYRIKTDLPHVSWPLGERLLESQTPWLDTGRRKVREVRKREEKQARKGVGRNGEVWGKSQ